MHPNREDIENYLSGVLGDSRSREIERHLAICEFCREFAQNFREFLEDLESAAMESLPEELNRLADTLFVRGLSSKIIDLKQLQSEAAKEIFLAADSEAGESQALVALGTFYSEVPEMVLKVMRDNNAGYDFIQLISEKEWMTSNVLVRAPEINRETITGEDGRAVFTERLPAKIDHLKWQLKFPDAIFDLASLKYDPEKVEYEKEVTLETDRKDKIRVKFQGKTEGKQIEIAVLSLEGKPEFNTVKIAVSCEGKNQFKNVRNAETVSFEVKEPLEEIRIRLYQ